MPHNPKKNGFRYTISQAGPQISYQNWLRRKYVYVYLRICMAGGGEVGGICRNTVKWIDSFFCDRQQHVVVNGVKSDWAPVL